MKNDQQTRAFVGWLKKKGMAGRVGKLRLHLSCTTEHKEWLQQPVDCSGLVLLGELLSRTIRPALPAANSHPRQQAVATATVLSTRRVRGGSSSSSSQRNSSATRSSREEQGHHLQELEITDASVLCNPAVLRAFLPVLEHVRHLKLTWPRIPLEYLTEVCSWYGIERQLKQQKLVMRLVLSQLTQLQSLSLHWVPMSNPKQCYLPYTLAGLTSLTRLTLSGVTVSPASFLPVEQAEGLLVMQHGVGGRQLMPEHLYIPDQYMDMGWGDPGTAADARRVVAGKWQTSSSGSSSRGSDVDGLVALSNLRHLELLCVKSWEHLYGRLADFAPNLELLHVGYAACSSVGEVAIGGPSGFTKLRELLVEHQEGQPMPLSKMGVPKWLVLASRWCWCVWSFRLSSPLRLPHLKFLFVLFVHPHLRKAWVYGSMILNTAVGCRTRGFFTRTMNQIGTMNGRSGMN